VRRFCPGADHPVGWRARLHLGVDDWGLNAFHGAC